MKSATPKALHRICGKEVTRHAIDSCFEAGIGRVIVIVGYQAEMVRQGLGSDVEYVTQEVQNGTGGAMRAAEHLLTDTDAAVVVIPGDAPLISPGTLEKMVQQHRDSGAASTLLTAIPEVSPPYGRIVKSADGRVERIAEAKDATPEQLAIKEVAVSIYVFQAGPLVECLGKLQPNNKQNELYLTDVVEMLASSGRLVQSLPVSDFSEVLGINTRADLADAAATMRARINREHMLAGVTIVDPATTYIDVDVEIGQDTIIHPCTIIERGARIGSNCKIGPFYRVRDWIVRDGSTVDFNIHIKPEGDIQ